MLLYYLLRRSYDHSRQLTSTSLAAARSLGLPFGGPTTCIALIAVARHYSSHRQDSPTAVAVD
jgi:hypothetical protein